jgi:transposase
MTGPSRYPEEFRREAVRLYHSGQQGGIDGTARALGVGRTALRRWVNQAGIDTGQAEGLTTDQKEELSRLKRENVVLREEREILKKAAAFFVRETDRTR